MRNKVILSIILMVVILLLSLTACGEPKFGVQLMVDGVLFQEIKTKGKESIEIPADPAKEGYTFAGWYLDENTWQQALTADYLTEERLTENLTVYAKWTINQYTITFNSNGGSEVATITGDYASEISEPTPPTKTGNVFRGWYLDEALQSAYTFSTMPAENLTLNAEWLIKHYTIRFDSNGGTAVSTINQLYASEVIKPANPTKETYAFVGWYLDEALQNEYTFNTMQAANVFLYAKWEIGQYTISFNSNGGSSVASITQEYATTVLAPLEPTKEGVTFSGWYLDEALQNKYTFTTMPSSDMTLFALWKEPTEGLVYTLINSDTEYEVSKGTASDSNIVIPKFYNGKMVTGIGYEGFKDYSSLTKIELPSSLLSIGNHAFINCSSLTNIEIPMGVTSIGNATFRNCTKLMSIKMPDSLLSIGNQAFYSCYNIINITLPSSVTTIGSGAFEYCYNLISIEIPSGVTIIEPNTFSGCMGLTSIIMPVGVTSIGDNAFDNCEDLTSVEIPSSVTSIGERVFHGCTSLSSINVDEENQTYSSINSSLYDKERTTLIKYAIGKTDTSFTTPNSVTNIGIEAFSFCDSLTNIIISSNVTSIGEGAFRACVSLTSIETAEGLTSIGTFAFQWCTNLATITIPSTVTSIGENAFNDCTSLSAINVDEANQTYSSIDSNLFTKDGTTLIQYAIGKTATSFTIPSSVTSIGDYAFSSCSSLISITIGSSVTSIGGFVFTGCSSLTSISIPSSVTTIEAWAFFGSSALLSITIPSSVISVGPYVFASCPNLTINAEAASKPQDWSVYWNTDNRPVNWSYVA